MGENIYISNYSLVYLVNIVLSLILLIHVIDLTIRHHYWFKYDIAHLGFMDIKKISSEVNGTVVRNVQTRNVTSVI